MDSVRCSPCWKLVVVFSSLVANVVLMSFLISNQITARCNFKVMRIVSEEYSIKKIEERLGCPHRIFYPGEELQVWPHATSNGRCPPIKKCVYLYSTSDANYLVYVDHNGYVDNVLCCKCRMGKAQLDNTVVKDETDHSAHQQHQQHQLKTNH